MKSFSDFKTALGFAEGSGDYKADNKRGYVGKYQFGKERLKDLGYTGTLNNLKLNPGLQENLFLMHVQDHAKYLVKFLQTAKSKIGSHITLSGLIAGAHLKGRGHINYTDNCKRSGVIQYILFGKDCSDGNGTKISTYVNKFSGFEIPGYNESEKKVTDNKIPSEKGDVKNSVLPFILIGIGVLIIIMVLKNQK